MKLKAIIATVAVVAVGVGATIAITQSTDKEEPTPPVNVEQSTKDTSSTVPETKPDNEATTESTTKVKDETTTAIIFVTFLKKGDEVAGFDQCHTLYKKGK